jgi:hypothetical protein
MNSKTTIVVTIFIPPILAGFYPPNNEVAVKFLARLLTAAVPGLTKVATRGDLEDCQLLFEADTAEGLEPIRCELQELGVLEVASIIWVDPVAGSEAELFYPPKGSWDAVAQAAYARWWNPTHSVKPQSGFCLDLTRSVTRVAMKHLSRKSSFGARCFRKLLNGLGVLLDKLTGKGQQA